MTMTTYSGPATLILADGARVAGMASLGTNHRGDLNRWSGTFRPNEVSTAPTAMLATNKVRNVNSSVKNAS